MCIIAVRYPNSNITKRTMRNCYQSNPDGGGFMYAANGKLHIEKGFFGFRKIYKRFRELERTYPQSIFVLHFRIATSGKVDAGGCHPFYVNNKIGFAHNGILRGLGDILKSDTQVFNEDVLQKLPNNFLSNKKVVDNIEYYADASLSKFVFLDNNNKCTIFKKDYGEFCDGVWYSNSGYKYSFYSRYRSVYTGKHDYDYRYDVYKNCCICGAWLSLSEMSYSVRLSGWLCKSCEGICSVESKVRDSKLIRCTMCKELFSEIDGKIFNNIFYCDDCWYTIKTSFGIDCPVCRNPVVLRHDNICPVCYTELEDSEFAQQLNKFEFC